MAKELKFIAYAVEVVTVVIVPEMDATRAIYEALEIAQSPRPTSKGVGGRVFDKMPDVRSVRIVAENDV